MNEAIKALIYVLALAVPALYLSQRISASAVARTEFVVWRNCWFLVTISAFLFSNFFIFSAAAAVVYVYGRSSGAAPVALFFALLFAVPIIEVPISGMGIVNKLFDLDNARLLEIVVLLPALFAPTLPIHRSRNAFTIPDRLIVAYVLLDTSLQIRSSEITNVARVGFTEILDILVPYFVATRTITTVADFQKVCMAIVISILPLSLIGALEVVKAWHTYSNIIDNWGGVALGGGYILRSGLLRASVTATSPIVFGYICMVAIGSFLAVRKAIAPQRLQRAALVILSIGLVASLSRGPWIGAAIMLFAFAATARGGASKFSKVVFFAVLLGVFMQLTPIGEKIINLLPFVGTTDEANVEYRKHLFENTMTVIERNLWFGSVDYLKTPEMLELTQGQGIIDIVNVYLKIALDTGIVGLTLFCGFFAAILIGLRRALKLRARENGSLNTCLRAAIGILLGILVTIGTASGIEFISHVYWAFGGLCVALIRIAYQAPVTTRRVYQENPIIA
jgi:hypothetical protein